MLDAVHLEERGVATLTFVTEPFVSAARTHARIHGLPTLPLVVVASDYLDDSDAVIAARIGPVIDEVIAALVATGVHWSGSAEVPTTE